MASERCGQRRARAATTSVALVGRAKGNQRQLLNAPQFGQRVARGQTGHNRVGLLAVITRRGHDLGYAAAELRAEPGQPVNGGTGDNTVLDMSKPGGSHLCPLCELL